MGTFNRPRWGTFSPAGLGYFLSGDYILIATGSFHGYKRPFTNLDWNLTPEPVRYDILYLEQALTLPRKQVQMTPECRRCGNTDFARCDMRPFYTHQQIELPKIEMEISHFILHQCSCPECGKAVKAGLPGNADTGYGPRMSAFVAELSGIKAMSRSDV